MYYLIEPYNAYQKPPKKKHWAEIAEEEELFFKIMEAQRQQQESQKINNTQNVALPQYSPQPPAQQVQDGQYAAPAGGGGWVPNIELEKQEVASFAISPSSGYSPLTVTFTNNTRTPEDDTFLWNFGTGSLTSTDTYPSPLTYLRTGSYVVTLQATSSAGAMTSTSKTVTVGLPVLVAGFNLTSGSDIAGVAFHFFTDTTTYNAYPQGIVTGSWKLGDVDGTTYDYTYLSGGFANVYTTGSFTASLELTESLLGLTSKFTRSFTVVPPTLTANFTLVSSSNSGPGFEDYEPMTASLTSTTTYNGGGLIYYNWYIKTGSVIASSSLGVTSTYTTYILSPGTYTASLQVTESTVNIRSTKNQQFIVQT